MSIWDKPYYEWTEEKEARLLDLWNNSGLSSAKIALLPEFKVGRSTIEKRLERLRTLGHEVKSRRSNAYLLPPSERPKPAKKPRAPKKEPSPKAQVTQSIDGRFLGPLPAGHAFSWAALWLGLGSFEGVPAWPMP